MHSVTQAIQEAMMSLAENTSVYQSPKETANHKHSEFWFALGLLCVVALVLVAASAMIAPAPIDSGISSETLLVGP
jgi:hypothetical protein